MATAWRPSAASMDVPEQTTAAQITYSNYWKSEYNTLRFASCLRAEKYVASFA